MNFSKKNHEHIKNNRYLVSKKLVLFILTFITLTIYAQSPEAFKYQAVVRDGSGNVIANQGIGIQITVLQTSVSGTAVYRETFTPTSNNFGLVNIEIGKGTVTLGIFADIDWGDGPYFIETAMDPAGGTSYAVTGTSQLLSVPYALYAGNTFWKKANKGIHYADSIVGVGTGPINNDTLVRFQIRANSGGLTTNLRLINDDPEGSTQMFFTGNGPDFNNLSLGINNTASPFNPNEAYLWYADNFDLKFGTNSTERLRIKNNGNIGIGTPTPNSKLQVTGGDVYIENVGSGVIMKSPDGNCWRMTVDNAGSPLFTSITCP